MEYLLSVVFYSLIIVIMYSVGAFALDAARVKCPSISENIIFSLGVGFGFVSYLVLILGMLKLLYLGLLVPLLLFFCLLGAGQVKKTALYFKSAFQNNRPQPAWLWLMAVISLVLLLACLAPSFSNDSLVYHLTDAKYFASNHRVGFIAFDSSNSLWPYLVEMHFTLALLFKLAPAAGLVQFFFFIITCLSVYSFAKTFFDRQVARISLVLFALVPGVHILTLQTYVDMALVFYFFAAFYAFFLFRNTSDLKWLMVSGCMTGLALSTKYFALIMLFLIFFLIVYDLIFEKRGSLKRIALALFAFFVPVVIFSFIWYLRQYWVLGNPLFPFFQDIFGSSGLNIKSMALMSEKGIREAYGVKRDLVNLLKLPWTLTMFPHKFGGEQIGPAFLAILPGFLLVNNLDKRMKVILITILLYLLAWFLQYQNLRFILPVVPMSCIASGYILSRLLAQGSLPRIIFRSMSLVYCSFVLFLLFYYCFPGIKTVIGLEPKESYLSRNERSYSISRYINSSLPAGSKVLVVDESHTYFIKQENQREIYHWLFKGYDEKAGSADAVMGYFRKSGFTHILFAEFDPSSSSPGSLRVADLIGNPEFRHTYLILLKEITPDSRNAEGVKYRLYQIKA